MFAAAKIDELFFPLISKLSRGHNFGTRKYRNRVITSPR